MSNKKNPRPTILIVDDKEENLLAMKRALIGLNADLICVNSGEKALEAALNKHFALILLDIQMPELSGFEVAALLQGNHETAAIPVIFITASDHADYINKAYEIGVVDFLNKPINKKVLLSKVKTFLLLDSQRVTLETLSKNLQHVNNHQTLLLNNARQGILGIDSEGKIISANPEACQLFATDEKDLLDKKLSLLFNEKEIDDFLFSHKNHNKRQSVTFCRNVWIQHNSQNKKLVELKVSLPKEYTGVAKGGVALFHDISHRKKKEQALLYEARHDSVTGLANRTLMREFLDASIARNQRRHKWTGVLFIDLDKFKTVNDSFGHECGDQLLNHVANRLARCTRKGDLVARQGGDEFVVILDEVHHKKDLRKVAEHIIQTLTRPFYLDEHTINIGVSIGLSLWPCHGKSAEDIIKYADKGMYLAKQQGGNRFCFYSEKNSKQ